MWQIQVSPKAPPILMDAHWHIFARIRVTWHLQREPMSDSHIAPAVTLDAVHVPVQVHTGAVRCLCLRIPGKPVLIYVYISPHTYKYIYIYTASSTIYIRS